MISCTACELLSETVDRDIKLQLESMKIILSVNMIGKLIIHIAKGIRNFHKGTKGWSVNRSADASKIRAILYCGFV